MNRPRPLSAVVAPPSDAELDAVATATGRAWATSTVQELRAMDRSVHGGWPGTLREARGQVLVALSSRRGPPVSRDRVDGLARTAYASARSEWGTYAEPDPEP